MKRVFGSTARIKSLLHLLTMKESCSSHARMWMAPMRDKKMSDYEATMRDWYRFVDDTKSDYGVDMSVLSNPFSEEQKKYYMKTCLWNNLHPHQVIVIPAVIKEIDCSKVTVNEILEVRSKFTSVLVQREHDFVD